MDIQRFMFTFILHSLVVFHMQFHLRLKTALFKLFLCISPLYYPLPFMLLLLSRYSQILAIHKRSTPPCRYAVKKLAVQLKSPACRDPLIWVRVVKQVPIFKVLNIRFIHPIVFEFPMQVSTVSIVNLVPAVLPPFNLMPFLSLFLYML